MYAQLTWDAKQGHIVWKPVDFQLDQLELSEPERKARLDRAAALVKEKIVGATEKESLMKQAGVVGDMTNVALRVPKGELDFAMHMCLAHHLLLPEKRKTRTDIFQRVVDAQFAEFKERPKPLKDKVNILKGLATLVYDTAMEAFLNTACARIRQELLNSSKEYESRRALTQKIAARMSKEKNKEYADWLPTILHFAFDRYASAEFEDLAGRVPHALDDPRLLENLYFAAKAGGSLFLYEKKLEQDYIFIAKMIKKALKGKVQGFDDWADFGDSLMREQRADHEFGRYLQLWASIDAVEAGIDMGEETPKFRSAVQLLGQVSAAVDRRMAKRLPKPQQGGSSGKAPSLNAEDPVLSWSIDKLAQWIEGPVVEPAKTVIDRAKIVARVHDAQKQGLALPAPTVVPHVTPGKPTPYKPTPAKPTSAKPLPAELTLDNVDTVVRTALQGCVQYFLAEIADMWPLAKALGGAVDVMNTLDHVATELKGLQFDPSHFSELTARNLLNKAEAQIQSLRDSLHKAQASAKLKAIFPQELSAALRKQPLVLGKRKGGQIGCPVLLEDWHFVNSTFHDRWLSEFACIEVDGTPMQLRPDQALALYVTGSSLSGYAFDVSVHLWRRRPGTGNPPSREQSPYPPMDKTCWYDTYATCCVLHVPLRH